jgi:hypothetical protein
MQIRHLRAHRSLHALATPGLLEQMETYVRGVLPEHTKVYLETRRVYHVLLVPLMR